MTPKPNRAGWRAALIGVSRYTDPHIGDIPAAANNIEDLKELLTAPVGAAFRDEDCVAIVDPDSPQQVGKLLADVTSQADDVLLVYYAGHGLLDQRGRLFLAVTGSDPATPAARPVPSRESTARGIPDARIVYQTHVSTCRPSSGAALALRSGPPKDADPPHLTVDPD